VCAVVLAGSIAVGTFLDAFGEDRDTGPLFTFPEPTPEPGVAGYGVDQLANACTIMVAGRDLGFDQRDQTIAVMTAMGESSLRNIDYGDWETSGVTNPDGSRTTSIGLFQQIRTPPRRSSMARWPRACPTERPWSRLSSRTTRRSMRTRSTTPATGTRPSVSSRR
jgi:hypothetical protein